MEKFIITRKPLTTTRKNIRSKKMILDVEMPSYNLRVNEQIDLGEVFLKAQAIKKKSILAH